MDEKSSSKRSAKQAIVEGMVDLMAASSAENIRVKELLIAADVTRSAFYYHFDSVSSVLDYMINDFTEGMARVSRGIIPDEESPLADWAHGPMAREATLSMFAFVYEHRAIYEALMQDAFASAMFQNRLRDALVGAYEECAFYFTDPRGRRCILAQREREYYVDVIVSRNLGVIECWRRRKFLETPEELVELSLTLDDLLRAPTVEKRKRYCDQGRVYLAEWSDLAE